MLKTKKVLTVNQDKLDYLSVNNRYKSICKDYVSGQSAPLICEKYQVGKSRLHYILQHTARTLISHLVKKRKR